MQAPDSSIQSYTSICAISATSKNNLQRFPPNNPDTHPQHPYRETNSSTLHPLTSTPKRLTRPKPTPFPNNKTPQGSQSVSQAPRTCIKSPGPQISHPSCNIHRFGHLIQSLQPEPNKTVTSRHVTHAVTSCARRLFLLPKRGRIKAVGKHACQRAMLAHDRSGRMCGGQETVIDRSFGRHGPSPATGPFRQAGFLHDCGKAKARCVRPFYTPRIVV